MKKSILLFALLIITVSNAQKLKKIKGNEKIISVTRTTSNYQKIKVAGSFDVQLIAGKEGNIIINGDENLVEFIRTEVKNGQLSVYFDKAHDLQYNYNSAITISIPFETINELIFSGSGNLKNTAAIVSENFDFTMSGSGNVAIAAQANTLNVNKSGSGNLNIKGSAIALNINSSGSGNANLSELNSENALASMSGSGNLKINVTANLQAALSGSGNIQYKGKPEKLAKSTVGSGEITSY